MKIKTMSRFLLCFFIIFFVIAETTVVVAAGPSAGHFFNKGVSYNQMINEINIEMSPIKHIQGLIIYAGVLSAIVIVLVFSIQWVTANAAKRQELKAGLYPLTIGVVLLSIGPKITVLLYDMFLKDNANIVDHANGIGGSVIKVVQTLGYIVAIVMILAVGIQWLTANPNKRQELKSRMVNIVIGAILIAAGVTILDWIAGIAKNDFTASLDDARIIASQSNFNIKV